MLIMNARKLRRLVDRPRPRRPARRLERVHRAYEGRLLGYVARRVADRAAAEDLVQETFLGFLTSLPNFDAAQPLEGYLFSIAAHKLTDMMRREGRRPTLPLASDDSSSDWQPADRACRASSLCEPRAPRPGGDRAGGGAGGIDRPLAAPRTVGSAGSAWSCCGSAAGRTRKSPRGWI